MDSESTEQNIHYFPKYLTNQKLLELQLSDVNFRRYILIQFLLLFQYLDAPVKFKLDNFKIKPEQQEWIKNSIATIYELINNTPPDGVRFSEVVKNILQREEQWNKWKNDGCPEVTKRLPTSDQSDMPAPKRRLRRNLGDVIKNMTANNKVFLGDPELTKLWNFKPDNLEACKGPERDFLPSFDSFFQEAFEQLDPELCIENQYKKVNDGNFGWRALRLLARKSPHFFAQSNNPIHKLSEYLENMIKKTMSKEKISINQGSDKHVSPNNKEFKKESVIESEEVDISEGIQDENENENNIELEDKNKIPKQIIEQVAAAIGDKWNILAEKLGYQPDEIEFVKTIKTTPLDQATYLLEVWVEDAENPKPENLIYILEEIQLIEAANILKS
ncbi:PREDICTED: THO complex subunit 1-like [Diuraphis noxia]|uniref:THO complex subunit 1-like n=1 Tax=Diuraphis noxia TaxID=143948 RepID=UPI000763915E|nr:PREDICTED: THO complex subunit 1-like [Diuraphis noxia]